MSGPVDRSITVSAPPAGGQGQLVTSWATDELPMLALTFTKKRRPMTIGSLSGWFRRPDLAQFLEVGVQEVLLVVGQAPGGQDGPAPAHDPSHPAAVRGI